MKFSYHFIIVTVFALLLSSSAFAQRTRDQNKSENKIKKELKKNPIKEARKEAKSYSKMGFKTLPGSLPMDKQLERCWIRLMEMNEDGTDKYLSADGNGVGKTQTAAELQAMEAAKLQLAGQISNEIVAIIETKIANEQIDRETGNSLTKVVEGGKNYIVQSLPYVRPSFKVHRNAGEKDVEVAVKLLFNAEQAKIAAAEALEDAVRNELEEESDELLEEIDDIFDLRRD